MSIEARQPVLPTLQPDAQSLSLDTMPLLIAVPDAARLLGIGTTLAWDLVRGGDLPSVKLGRRVLIPRAVLERLAHADETQATGHQEPS